MAPPVMLCDKLTSALDPETVGEILAVMRGVTQEGTTIVCLTHEMGFARDVAELVWFINAGRILEKARPEALFH